MAAPAARRPAWRPARLRAVVACSSLVLLPRRFLFGDMAPPQIGTALPGQSLRFIPPPGADLLVVARHQHLRNCPPLPELWPGVVRVFEQPLGKTFLRQRLGAANNAGQQPYAGVDQRDRRRLAARQDEIAEAHLLDQAGFEHALVNP